MATETTGARLRRSRRAAFAATAALVAGLVGAPALDTVQAIPAAAAVGDLSSSTGATTAFVADAGTGRYLDRIVWVNWGTEGASLPANGSTAVTQRQEVSATSRLEVTCTMTRGSGQNLEVYRAGAYDPDGLPQLYRSTGTPIVSGFRAPLGTNRSLRVACSAVLATYSGAAFTGTRSTQNVALGGLVFVDPESTHGNEAVAAQPVNATNARWHIIDRYAGTCGGEFRAVVNNNNRLTLSGQTECTSGHSATAVAFAENATTLDITLTGSGGMSAGAIGYVLGVDYGDAAATYGAAPAVVQPTWTAGTALTTTARNVLAPGFTLSSMAAPATRLGAQAFPNRTVPASTDATGDVGWTAPGAAGPTADEDAFTTAPAIVALAGSPRTYTLTVPCSAGTGGAAVRGWIDWNRNGTFADGEGSNTVGCSGQGSTTTLTWSNVTVAPAQLGATTLRLAIGGANAQVATATTAILVGEVEDWQVTLTPALRVTKTADVATMPAGGDVTFTVTVTNASSSSVTAYVVDDYTGAWDDATLGAWSPTTGVTHQTAVRRLSWQVTLAAGESRDLTYTMTTRSAAGGPGDQVMTNVVVVASQAVGTTTPVTCVPESAEATSGTCARTDLYRPALTVDKQAYRATDTTFTSPLADDVVLAPGTSVRWRYVVTNTGSTVVEGVTLGDAATETRTTADGTATTTTAPLLTCPGLAPGTSVTLGTLAPGDVRTCTATGVVVPDP